MASQVSRLKPTGLLRMGMDERNDHSVKSGKRDALLGRILDAVDRMKDSHRKLRRATRDINNRAARCVEAEGAIFEN